MQVYGQVAARRAEGSAAIAAQPRPYRRTGQVISPSNARPRRCSAPLVVLLLLVGHRSALGRGSFVACACCGGRAKPKAMPFKRQTKKAARDAPESPIQRYWRKQAAQNGGDVSAVAPEMGRLLGCSRHPFITSFICHLSRCIAVFMYFNFGHRGAKERRAKLSLPSVIKNALVV